MQKIIGGKRRSLRQALLLDSGLPRVRFYLYIIISKFPQSRTTIP